MSRQLILTSELSPDAIQMVMTMPFKKVGPNKYKSPSGHTFTRKQVVAYYATGGFRKPVRKKRR
jgi:hypothetical protein